MVRRSPPQVSPSPDWTGKRVLLVDDDRATLQRVQEGLSPFGLEIFVAFDGASGLTALRARRPDLLITDVEMPGLSGLDLCRIVKANQGPQGFGFVPVLLLTSRRGGRIEGLELGADDYLFKPVDIQELSARVKSVLRLKALHDALLEKNQELDRLNRELERLSRTDPLTGLHNRRFLEERLEAEFLRARRYASPLSCLMLDIDHFKRLNDSHGHLAGDQVLRKVADVVRGSLRNVDLLARYGGEELVALLPETPLEEARGVAERIRKAISEVRVEKPAAPQTVLLCTASIGVATCPHAEIQDGEGLLRSADDALYLAKAAGRDRVQVHSDSRFAGPPTPG